MSDYRSEHAEQLVNHWYWRPGWRPGRQFYTWHLTFEDQQDLYQLVTEYQHALHDIEGLDMVPLAWLHITVQGVGFIDEILESEVKAIAAAVRRRLAELPRQTVRFCAPTVRPQAIALYPEPSELLHSIRNAIRTGMTEATSEDQVPEGADNYTPHLSIAYANRNNSSEQALNSLYAVTPTEIAVEISKASLISLRRDGHTYKWHKIEDASLHTL